MQYPEDGLNKKLQELSAAFTNLRQPTESNQPMIGLYPVRLIRTQSVVEIHIGGAALPSAILQLMVNDDGGIVLLAWNQEDVRQRSFSPTVSCTLIEPNN